MGLFGQSALSANKREEGKNRDPSVIKCSCCVEKDLSFFLSSIYLKQIL